MISLVSSGTQGFYEALEKVLAWLTEAEHKLILLAGSIFARPSSYDSLLIYIYIYIVVNVDKI